MDAALLHEVWATLVCFTTVLLASELTFCLPNLPRRPRFLARAAVAIPVYVALFNSHLLVVPSSARGSSPRGRPSSSPPRSP